MTVSLGNALTFSGTAIAGDYTLFYLILLLFYFPSPLKIV